MNVTNQINKQSKQIQRQQDYDDTNRQHDNRCVSEMARKTWTLSTDQVKIPTIISNTYHTITSHKYISYHQQHIYRAIFLATYLSNIIVTHALITRHYKQKFITH